MIVDNCTVGLDQEKILSAMSFVEAQGFPGPLNS